jgi:hypothetical protein
MLIRELHSTAQGIDGSGGDDGRDIRWDSPDGLVIFEVKSYTERLGNPQKRGIKHSLKKASRHKPICWVLILPLEPSPSEEKWFDNLRRDFAPIELEWRGLDWLNAEFAKRESFIRYIEGPLYVLAERAKELEHEKAVLANGISDAIERQGILTNRIDELSNFWKVQIGIRKGGGHSLTYSEKFPGARNLDPVTLNPVFPSRQIIRRQRASPDN